MSDGLSPFTITFQGYFTFLHIKPRQYLSLHFVDKETAAPSSSISPEFLEYERAQL